MKRILTFITIISFAVASQAQITWDKSTADTARGFESQLDIETHNVVTFAVGGTYRWLRTYNESCSVKTAICDKNSCYLETTDSAEFTVTPSESFDMICHFYPYDTCCTDGASVSLYVFKIDEPSVNSTATYILDLWCSSLSSPTITNNAFTIAPNPANAQITLSNLPINIESIEIVDILGKTISSLPESTTIDISSFKAGLYWVAIKSEGVTYTQRFVKQ
ncbi:MAG: hypothetical protein ACI9JN_001820 [Bacteroidia bacterium]|jgi:hypothetical protein